MDQLLPYFKGFQNRQAKLEKVTRYSLHKTMLYRTNLWIHSQRVFWLVEEISPFAQKEFKDQFDREKALIMALIHDDAELIISDYPAGNKSKMSQKELAKIRQKEKEAINRLAKEFPRMIGRYSYKELLEEILEKKTILCQIIDLADKIDAFGEALHEIYAGNLSFISNPVNQYGLIPTPYQYYIDYLNAFLEKFPQVKPLFRQDFWMFKKPRQIDFKSICFNSSPHTPESIKKETGYPFYDEWKKVLLKNGGKEELVRLTKQIEQLKPLPEGYVILT